MRMIDADNLFNELSEIEGTSTGMRRSGLIQAMETIGKQPTVSHKRALWIRCKNSEYTECSNCHGIIPADAIDAYCPQCGARMEGVPGMTNREWIYTKDNHDFAEEIFKPGNLCAGCPVRRHCTGMLDCGMECEKGLEKWLGKEFKEERKDGEE